MSTRPRSTSRPQGRGNLTARARAVAAARAKHADGKAQHLDWLGLAEISGPFLTLPVLETRWPELDSVPKPLRGRLRVEYGQWREDPARGRDAWARFLLGDLLEWGDALAFRGAADASDAPSDAVGQAEPRVEQPVADRLLDCFGVTFPEHDDAWVSPDFALLEPGTDRGALADELTEAAGAGPAAAEGGASAGAGAVAGDGAAGKARLLGTLLPAGCHPTRRLPEAVGGAWAATPADRLARLLRRHGVALGLVTDGRFWTLVWAPVGGVTTTATFDTVGWNEAAELNSVRAFRSLLCRRQFFGVPDEQMLVPLLEESGRHQEDITDALGVQVRQAVELLVEAIGRADNAARERGEPGLRDRNVTAPEVYRGAVSVMMRIVFLLFAEERGLLPADNEVYARAYSAGQLCTELEQRAQDENEANLRYSTAAWHRLIALFHAVYGGVSHPDLELPAYDGSLFDPKAHWWLEGVPRPGTDAPPPPLLGIDDQAVLHMLRSVQYVTIKGERRSLTFRALNVEQIGYVYEGLLSYDARRATRTVVGLVGKSGQEVEVELDELERIAARHGIGARADSSAEPDRAGLAAELSATYKDSGIGSPKALEKRLAPLSKAEQAEGLDKALAACRGDAELAERVLPFYGPGPKQGLIRSDMRGLPLVVLPGGLYVTDSSLRKNTGTHYTPPELAEQVVEGALEPLVYEPGPLTTGDKSEWVLKSPEEILSLKVVDIAMGSAAFLVAACRYLADKLIESRARDGGGAVAVPASAVPLSSSADAEVDETVIEARREIIEHCLYGADINPLAVEMAKLSLWLVSMDPKRPFTFLDDRLVAGDSLLGISSLEQLEVMDLDAARGRKRHARGQVDFTAGVRELVAELARERRDLVELPDDDVRQLESKREILARVREQARTSLLLADLTAGAELASHGEGTLPAGEFLTKEMRRNGWAVRRSDAPLSAAGYGRLVVEGRDEDAIVEARELAEQWLDTGLPDGGMKRDPLHWPLEFPEVFERERGGFDAVIGNPPFLGGQKLTGAMGEAYREYLVSVLGRGRRGSADLVAYFLLRAHGLLNEAGQAGLIATNTLAQGDTREVGLDQLVADGVEIRQAVKSKPWPSKSAVLEFCAVWTSRRELGPGAVRMLGVDQEAVLVPRGIGASLNPRWRASEWAERLEENAGVSFIGSYVLGLGFTLPESEARVWIAEDEKYADVLFPYLNGQDINTSPTQGTERWVIDFRDWTEEQAKGYPKAYEQVMRNVKPERERNNRKVYRDYWWQYAEKRPAMVKAMGGRDQCIVISRVSKVVMPIMVSTGCVFSEQIVVIASDDFRTFALLSSAPHYWWAIDRASTLETRVRYTPSDVFETLVRPTPTPELRDAGTRLHTHRRELMLRRDIGLTATYNLVHDPDCTDADINELRAIHRDIDVATAKAYEWDDLLAAENGLEHGFHETDQGTRYTIGIVLRTEILDRLRELNHQKYADEVARGLHKKPKKYPDMPAPRVSFESGELFPPDDALF
ncbi:Eco57I restriction-modification methylase domain-containing protein [Streptomyces smyrnaeus]|uniref:Eco57I restriction-modification methylase domain-containing protein n=1 Tax=Streptomyces smyrnaeus TaxID=1387713 RepID=UPI0036D06819